MGRTKQVLPREGIVATTYLWVSINDGTPFYLPHISPAGELTVTFGEARIDQDGGSFNKSDGQPFFDDFTFETLVNDDTKSIIEDQWAVGNAKVQVIRTDGFRGPEDPSDVYDIGVCEVVEYKQTGTDLASATPHKMSLKITRSGQERLK